MNETIKKYKQSYNDLNAYSKSFRIGHPEHDQLEPGEFTGEICQVVSVDVIACTLKSNRKMLETGRTLKGFTVFLLPGNMQQDFSWRKHRLTGQRIGILRSHMPHSAIIMSNFFGTPIAIRNDYLKKLIIELSFDEILYQQLQRNEVVEIAPEEALLIQKLVINLCTSKKPKKKVLFEELPILLLQSIEKQADQFSGELATSTDLVFNKTIQFIKDNLNHKISTHSICKDLQISDRTLRYMFNNMTGLSPMKFIKRLRLNRVRKEIIYAKEKVEINKVAANWGFIHSGQFAADYKKLFGEYPSETANAVERDNKV